MVITEHKQALAFLSINSVQLAVYLDRLQKQADSSREVQQGEEAQSPAPRKKQPPAPVYAKQPQGELCTTI